MNLYIFRKEEIKIGPNKRSFVWDYFSVTVELLSTEVV